MSRPPRSLTDNLRQGRALLFAGAGLSKASDAPTWAELLLRLVERAREENQLTDAEWEEALDLIGRRSAEDNYAVADFLEKKLHRQIYVDEIVNAFKALEPTSIHDRLVQHEWKCYVTTNYDTLIEDAYRNAHGEDLTRITASDTDDLSRMHSHSKVILKLHGCITKTQSIVLSRRSLDQLEEQHILRRFQTMLEDNEAVFVGYGLADPDITAVLRELVSTFDMNAQQHHIVVPDWETGVIRSGYLDRRYQVRPLTYSDENRSHGDGLRSWVDELFRAAAPADHPEREKVLFCVKALRDVKGVPQVHMLATDQVERWAKAWMLPTVDDENEDITALAQRFAREAGLQPGDVAIQPGPFFEEEKRNPSLDERNTKFSFRAVGVAIKGNPQWFDAASIKFHGRDMQWVPFEEMREHQPTVARNGNVMNELVREYGRGLEGLAYAQSGTVLATHDPYAERAAAYADLPWVRQKEAVRKLLAEVSAEGHQGVLDLGCGPAASAAVVIEEYGLNYRGIDKSPAMLGVAQKEVEALGGGSVELGDFRYWQEVVGDGWLVLLKNALHLVENLHEFLQEQLPSYGDTVAIAETVSPDPSSRFWIQSVFDSMDARHKHHMFVEGELEPFLEICGWEILSSAVMDQAIDVDVWLGSFALNSGAHDQARRDVLGAPTEVKQAMRMKNEDGLSMLRRQSLITARRAS